MNAHTHTAASWTTSASLPPSAASTLPHSGAADFHNEPAVCLNAAETTRATSLDNSSNEVARGFSELSARVDALQAAYDNAPRKKRPVALERLKMARHALLKAGLEASRG